MRRVYHALALSVAVSACSAAHRDPDVLTVLSLSRPEHIDPRHPEDAFGSALSRLVFGALLDSDPRTFLPRPSLARSLTWRGATQAVLELRDDVRFHDGRALRAEDVVATFQSVLDPRGRSRLRGTYARVIRDVRAEGRSVVFDLHRADGSFESLLQLPILRAEDARAPQELVARDGASLLGTGDLRVRSLREGAWEFARATLRADRPGRVRVVPLRDANALALRMLHADGDVAELKPDLLPVFEGARDFVVRASPSAGFTYVGIRADRGPLADVRVRRALAHAIDREGLRRARLGRYAVPATGPMPPSHWAYEGDVPRYAFDPPRARALLDEAGLRAGAAGAPRVTLTLRVSSQRFAMLVGQAIVSMLADVGVAVELRPSELGTLLADLRAGRFDLTLLTVPDLSDPWGLSFWFASTSIPTTENPNAGGNRWRYRSADLDRALDAGARAVGADARAPHYRLAQRILAADLPVIPLWHADVVAAVRRTLIAPPPRGDGRLDHLLDARWARGQ